MHPTSNEPSSIYEQVLRLSMVVFGLDGSNGLRSEVRKNKAEMDAQIRLIQSDLEKRSQFEEQIKMIWTVLQWVALALSTTVGLLLASPLGPMLGAALVK